MKINNFPPTCYSNLNIELTFRRAYDEDILTLEVTVDDSLLVQIVQGFSCLADDILPCGSHSYCLNVFVKALLQKVGLKFKCLCGFQGA